MAFLKAARGCALYAPERVTLSSKAGARIVPMLQMGMLRET